MTPSRRKGVLLYNPTSGRQSGRRLHDQVCRQLSEGGFDVVFAVPTRGPGDASVLAAEAVNEGGLDVVFAMGGDGTVREAAGGLLGSEVALGVIPAGTANVFARALGLPRRPLPAARVVSACVARAIDVGQIGDHTFLMQASAGLDSRIMAEQNAFLKRWLGRSAFAYSGLRSWWTYDYRELVLEVEDQRRKVGFFAACNIPFYGGGFRLAPNATIFDRHLDLVTSGARSRAATLGFARDLVVGRHHRRRDVEISKVDRIAIVSPNAVEVQLDGDVMTIETPCQVKISAERLLVLMPPGDE